MGTGANTAQIGTYGHTGGSTIGQSGGSFSTFNPGYQASTNNVSGFAGNVMPGDQPMVGGSFLENLSFGEQYGIASGLNAITKGIGAFSKTNAEKQSFEWKAEMFRRNAMLKQRQIDDMKKVGKEKEAELLRKYKLLKIKAKGKKNNNILQGAGSALDILMGIDIVEAADMGVLRTNAKRYLFRQGWQVVG